MAYVEVWVEDPAPNDDQVSALKELALLATELADRHWPDVEARLLDRAVHKAIRLYPECFGAHFGAYYASADERYKQWLSAKNIAEIGDNHEAPG